MRGDDRPEAPSGGEVAARREPPGLTRADFVRRAAGGGAGLLLGGGVGAYGLVTAGDAAAASSPGHVQVFKSEPKLRPPEITILRRPPADHDDGYVFIAPSSGPGQR